MLASARVGGAVEALIRDTYSRLSTPGAQFADLFCDPDLVIVGSGVDELLEGPEVSISAGAGMAMAGFEWKPGDITVWEHGVVALKTWLRS